MLNAYPAAFGCHKSKTVIFKLINVKDHGIQKTRTTPAGNGKQLQILTFLDGSESVCKLVCAIGDCLDTPGRLEDLPGGFFSVRRSHRELYEAPKRSASEESAITCHGPRSPVPTRPWSWTTGGSIVCLFEDARKVTIYSARARC